MKFYSLTFILFLITSTVFGQLVNLPGNFDVPLRETIEGKKVSGERFFNSSYKSGIVFDNSGKEYQVFLKYDMYKDEVEVYNDGKAIVLQKNFYPQFRLDYFDEEANARRLYTFKSGFVIDGFIKANYFQILLEDAETVLLKANKVTLEEYTASEYGGKNEVFNKFVNRDRYFLYQKDGSYIELINKKSKLQDSFEEYEEQIKKFIKANKLKFKTEDDLVELVTYYLQLNS